MAGAVGAAVGLAVVILGLALANAIPFAAGTSVLVLGATVGGLFAVTTSRLDAATRAVEAGPYQPVHAVGWTRPPDGCNIGLFLGDGRDEPDVVVRLPIVRSMTTADGWVAGDVTPGLGRAGRVVAVFRSDGELMGAGRIVPTQVGRERWARSSLRSHPLMPGSAMWQPPANPEATD